MSSVPAWVIVSDSEQSVQLRAADFCAHSTEATISPYDDFVDYLGSVVTLGTPEALASSNVLGRVLLLGIVSGTEMYFRAILANLIAHCRLSRTKASEHMLSLQAVDYYGVQNIGYGLMENISFASEGEVLRATAKLVGIAWDKKDSIATAIGRFETLSHLRHAAVHARGELNARNLRALDVISTDRQCLKVEFNELQHTAEICLNAVRAYNRFVFQRAIERWIAEGVLSGDWKYDKQPFCRMISIFIARPRGGKRFVEHMYQKIQPMVIAAKARRITPPAAATPTAPLAPP